MICAGNIFDYYNLRHFKEIKYFSRDGRTMPNGIGFQRGNFIKECADNANRFVLSEVVFSGQKSPNGKSCGVIILPVNTNNNLNDDTITKVLQPFRKHTQLEMHFEEDISGCMMRYMTRTKRQFSDIGIINCIIYLL